MANGIAGIFCRSCGYDLRSLAEKRCPECGREFDPGERRSYDLKPRRRVLTRWIWRSAILLVLAAGTVSGLVGWTWRGWERDRVAFARLGKFGIVRKELVAMPVMERILPERYQYLRTRVWSVCLGTKTLKDEDWELMQRMDYLRDARFGSIPAGDSVLQRVEALHSLTELHIGGKSIDDAGLIRLAQSLPKLQQLYLGGVPISDVGIAGLGRLASLKLLSLYDCEVSDTGLMGLAEMRSLRELTLYKAPLVTDEGVARFRAARPEVKVKRLTE